MTMMLYLIARADEPRRWGDQCKIGITGSLDKRLAQIRTHCPFPVEIAFAFRIPDRKIARLFERAAHAVLEDVQAQGEWFTVPAREALEAMVEAIHGVCKAMPQPGGRILAEAIWEHGGLAEAVAFLNRNAMQ